MVTAYQARKPQHTLGPWQHCGCRVQRNMTVMFLQISFTNQLTGAPASQLAGTQWSTNQDVCPPILLVKTHASRWTQNCGVTNITISVANNIIFSSICSLYPLLCHSNGRCKNSFHCASSVSHVGPKQISWAVCLIHYVRINTQSDTVNQSWFSNICATATRSHTQNIWR